MHPGSNRVVAVRWRNPTGFLVDIQVLGRVTDLDGAGGDGVNYSVVRAVGNLTLASGTVTSVPTSLDSRTFYAATTVGPNQDVFFIIDKRTIYTYDTTELDVLITATLNCAATVPISC